MKPREKVFSATSLQMAAAWGVGKGRAEKGTGSAQFIRNLEREKKGEKVHDLTENLCTLRKGFYTSKGCKADLQDPSSTVSEPRQGNTCFGKEIRYDFIPFALIWNLFTILCRISPYFICTFCQSVKMQTPCTHKVQLKKDLFKLLGDLFGMGELAERP